MPSIWVATLAPRPSNESRRDWPRWMNQTTPPPFKGPMTCRSTKESPLRTAGRTRRGDGPRRDVRRPRGPWRHRAIVDRAFRFGGHVTVRGVGPSRRSHGPWRQLVGDHDLGDLFDEAHRHVETAIAAVRFQRIRACTRSHSGLIRFAGVDGRVLAGPITGTRPHRWPNSSSQVMRDTRWPDRHQTDGMPPHHRS